MCLLEPAPMNDIALAGCHALSHAMPFALWTLDGFALDRVITLFSDGAPSPLASPSMVDLACDNVRVIDANAFAGALFGSETPAALLRPMRYLFAAAPETAGRVVAARLAGRREHVEDMTIRRFDGRPLDVLLHVTFPLPEEPTKAILVLMVDVTGRLRSDELMSSIAHEIRQPLSAIATNTDASLRWLDRDTPNLEKVRLLLARIGANARRASDLLLRSHGTTRAHAAEHPVLDLDAVVAETCELVRHEAEDRGIDFEVVPADTPLGVRGDRIQLQQVVFNLLMNAMQAVDQTGVGRRRVSVSTRFGDERVCLSVEDTGPGVPPGDLERIFLRAFTTKPDGMGLGLAICRSIIEAHHGSIRASNLPGGGARFDVALPACRRP